jgi:hypothetical protein
MAIAAQSLFEEAKCYECYGPLTQGQLLTLALLRRIALAHNAAAQVSPQQLISATTCYACLGLSMFELMELGLLNIIAI